LAIPVHNGTGHQVTGEQDRDIGIDPDPPGTDEGADLAPGFGRRSRFPGQPDTVLVQFGRTWRCHHVDPLLG
jgi:hypothetical protein